MKKRILILLLCLCLALSGCGSVDVGGFFRALGQAAGAVDSGHSLREAIERSRVIPYSEMVYTRPDLTELEALQTRTEQAATEGDLDAVIEGVNGFFEAYDRFYTAYALADIRYSGDLTDEENAEEYDYCTRLTSRVDGMLDDLYRALASSPLRRELESDDYFGAGFFDAYEGESVYTGEFLTLTEEESGLRSRYYALSNEASGYPYGTAEYYDSCWEEMAQVLAELIRNRRQQAQCQGYESYVEFIYDFAYYRDYTPSQARAYMDEIRQTLVPLYRRLDESVWEPAGRYASETKTLEGLRAAAKAMGGTVWEAFRLMELGGLYDISYSPNKYNASFEMYLSSYEEPFLFLNPERTRYDSLTLAHEFGHFCSDYASYGSSAGIDVEEVFSQGMEYLLLCWGEEARELAGMKLADSLCTYVEQSCYAAFEERMYSLPEAELTPEGLRNLYALTAKEFGIDEALFDSRDFVTVTHFYTNPMYIISYVVSNDAAMQLYQLELAESGAGRSRYEKNLDTLEMYFLAFLEEAGLRSPFDRVAEVRDFFLDQGIGG